MDGKKIVNLLQYAENHTEYYSKLFSDNGINTGDINDFAKIPFLSKADIQANEKEIISDKYDINSLLLERTSGSSGIPLNCRYDKNERIRRSLALWGERKKNSPDIMGQKIAIFHAGNRRHANSTRNGLIARDGNTLYINYLNVGDSYVEKIYDALIEFSPYMIRCQPSILFELVTYCKRNNKSTRDIQAQYIELGSEYLFEYIRDEIIEAFPSAIVANNYGTQEFFCVAYSCANHNLHIVSEQLHVETVNEDEEGYGEIIITSLHNYAMPLIRYRIGDIGKIQTKPCSCGRKEPVLQLKSGRTSEFFMYGSNKVHAHIFKNCIESFNVLKQKTYIKQFQVTQLQEQHFEFKIVSDYTSFQEELRTHIKSFFLEKLGIELEIIVSLQEQLTIDEKSNKLKVYNFLQYDKV
ncbi:hypothetical protein BK131_19165 [Paenibacillus amylolyticus]|uniref:Phenylacetate--CoA ligase family protein n=1 Tax=Paenibacillus amylolyticus TaxID=1451 RepID=A0A1R1BQT9_PAEAM|nr:phenylacetate--CoA ligase family protein [Paenibacillus amylolyticus]OMF12125.1 hypothetical protein BK131_19165 [Paenibacillus amylolyticus]